MFKPKSKYVLDKQKEEKILKFIVYYFINLKIGDGKKNITMHVIKQWYRLERRGLLTKKINKNPQSKDMKIKRAITCKKT
jgi:hypothetical protein